MKVRRIDRVYTVFRKIFALICALLTAVYILPADFTAQDAVDNVVRVGYYENELFEEGARDGAVKSGYAYEYYRKMSEYTGWEYEYVYGSYADLYQMLLDGKIDLLAGLAYKEEREGILLYPNDKMGQESYNLVKHTKDDTITADPSTLKGHSIGVLDSAVKDVLNNYLQEHGVSPEIVIFEDYDLLFDAFEKQMVDVVAAEGDGAYGRNNAEVLTAFGLSDYYLCVNINRQDLLKQLNQAQSLLAAEEPNYVATLQAKYYSSSLTSRAFSAAELEWLASHDTLRIGYLDDFLPYSDLDKNGKVNGLVKDLVPAMLNELNIKDLYVSYQAYERYDEMIQAIDEGKIDAVFPAGGGLYYAEENGINLTNTVIRTSSILVFLDEYDENTEKRIAVNENNRIQYYYLLERFPDAEIIMYPSIDACLDAVMKGEATCTTLNSMRAGNIVKNYKYDKLSVVAVSGNDDLFFGVAIDNKGLLKLLNRGVNVLGMDYAEDLAYGYTGELYTYTLLDAVRDHIVLFITLLLLIIAMIVFFFIRDTRRKKKQIVATENARRLLEEKNQELAKSEEALSEALMVAEHANQAKTIFLNNMSHDIRTPMNAIVGFTALAATNIDNKVLVKDYLSKISVSSRHLLSLINDVLDMSRIESGKMKIDETDVSLPEIMHDLRTIIQSNVKAKQQELFIDTQDITHENIVTDKLRLNQVLLNILTNAVKFTPSGGTISFKVIEKHMESKDKTRYEFRIKDNGIGMSEEFQKNIFEAFSRERTTTVSGIQGTGLGMAITKNILDLMGGTITVTSEVGKGSEFVVNLPCKISDHDNSSEPIPELQGLRALVADDSTDTCLSICRMLRDIGMRPDWTNYGKEAVIRAQEAYEQGDRFKAYIIDWLMPDMNGIETVRRIRKVIGDSDPIIILTAYDWTDIEAEAREAGVTAFCSKPLFLSELKNVLSEPLCIKEKEENAETPSFAGKRILLAEDNDLNQIIAVSVLENLGFEIDVASDGEVALNMFKDAPAGHYDLILMDIQMPKMDGYECARHIRMLEDEQKAKIPIIAVTANAFEEDRKVALETGMDGHLAKPYDIPKMIETIGSVLKNN